MSTLEISAIPGFANSRPIAAVIGAGGGITLTERVFMTAKGGNIKGSGGPGIQSAEFVCRKVIWEFLLQMSVVTVDMNSQTDMKGNVTIKPSYVKAFKQGVISLKAINAVIEYFDSLPNVASFDDEKEQPKAVTVEPRLVFVDYNVFFNSVLL
jgi:hypothetical protein